MEPSSGSPEKPTGLRRAGLFEVPKASNSPDSTPSSPSKSNSSQSIPVSSPSRPIASQRGAQNQEPQRNSASAALLFESQLKRYFVQLTVGCGNPLCTNRFCRSAQSSQKLSDAEAAIWAANLAAGPTAHLCPAFAATPATVAETSPLIVDDVLPIGSPGGYGSSPSSETTFSQQVAASLLSPFSNKTQAAGLQILTKKKKDSPKHSYILSRVAPQLDLPDDEFETSPVVIELGPFLEILERCESLKDFSSLVSFIKQVFSSPEALNQSFHKIEHVRADMRNVSGSRLEEQAALQMGMIDLDAISLVYSTISDHDELRNAFVAALEILFLELQSLAQQQSIEFRKLRVFIVLLASPILGQTTLPNYTFLTKRFLKAFIMLTSTSIRYLLLMISKWPSQRFQSLVDSLQVCINTHVVTESQQQQETLVLYACEVLKQLSAMNDERKILPSSAFYNTLLNLKMNMKERFKAWKTAKDHGEKTRLDIFDYPLILDPIAKSRIFHIESFLAMSGELEDTYVVALFRDTFADIAKNSKGPNDVIPPSHLILKVRREHLLEDTIEQIVSKVKYIRKPLKVSFVGEEGVDYSGVQKEFFQMLVEAVFGKDLGLWKYDEAQRFFWFSHKRSPDARRLFKFAGILFGLAIYNGIILDVNFPLVLYKKLLHKKPTLADLSDFNPQMAQGLQKLLTFEGDVESTFCYSFETSITKSDGSIITVELKPDGSNIPVTNLNRKEYVDAYVEWVFNSSVRDQFDPFCSGFHLVCDGYALRMCRPEELEQLICGSRVLNFDELKEETEYVGFTESSAQIRWFWQIVLAMNEEEKKKLLQFVTGSDRAPIEGLRSLPFRIQRNGPDSERLPTSHTCFSVLMLPEYSSKEKLRRLLTTAIQNSQGFGLM